MPRPSSFPIFLATAELDADALRRQAARREFILLCIGSFCIGYLVMAGLLIGRIQ